MMRLIEDLMTLAVADVHQLSCVVEPVSLIDVMDQVAGYLQSAAALRKVSLTVQRQGHMPVVLADAARLQQILLNLVSNAIKYGHEGGYVVMATPTISDDLCTVTVSDDGPGMNAEQVGRLFNSFERVGQEKGSIPGTGLGLAVSLRFAQAMGGNIDVESRLHHGSKFTVTLRLAE
jgi:signal transduction histidine kinase